MVNLYIINETSRAAIYGIGTYIRELTAALKDSDIRVCEVYLHSEELAEPDNIQRLYIPSPVTGIMTKNWKIQNELYSRNVVYLLRLHIKNTENLVFHLNNYQSLKLAKELRKSFDCKIIVTIHYFEWCFNLSGNVRRFRKILATHEDRKRDSENDLVYESYRKEKELFEIVDKIVCLAENAQKIMQYDYKIESNKIIVIPNGLTDMARTMPQKKLLRKKWHIPYKEKIILFAGRIEEAKGINYLFEAFRNVLTVYPKSRLVIAGDGDFSKYSKESQDICAKITHTGFLDKTQLYEFYSLADIGVLPSLFETFGYVAVEMMMHALPVVATATSGLNEVIGDACGFKIPIIQHPEKIEIDIDSLTEKILCLLKNPAQARKMGQNGRKRFLKEYSLDIFRQNMLNFYQSLNNYESK